MDVSSRINEHCLERVRDDLADRYGTIFTPDEVTAVVERGRAVLERASEHQMFLPALVEHWARDELLAAARATGRSLSPLPKLLFVCERGEGRSQVAAALAEHLSGGQVLVRSGGLHPTGRLNPHARTVLAERGIELHGPLPSEVQEDALDAADVLILIGCRDADFTGRHTIRWDIEDPYAQELDTARRIADELEAHVRDLLVELEVVTRQELAAESLHRGDGDRADAAPRSGATLMT